MSCGVAGGVAGGIAGGLNLGVCAISQAKMAMDVLYTDSNYCALSQNGYGTIFYILEYINITIFNFFYLLIMGANM